MKANLEILKKLESKKTLIEILFLKLKLIGP